MTELMYVWCRASQLLLGQCCDLCCCVQVMDELQLVLGHDCLPLLRERLLHLQLLDLLDWVWLSLCLSCEFPVLLGILHRAVKCPVL